MSSPSLENLDLCCLRLSTDLKLDWDATGSYMERRLPGIGWQSELQLTGGRAPHLRVC